MESRSRQPVDYKTHILVAVRGDGAMTVIYDWPHVPTQAEVQEQIVDTQRLCRFRPLHADVNLTRPGRRFGAQPIAVALVMNSLRDERPGVVGDASL
jgi:hypothetical protein